MGPGVKKKMASRRIPDFRLVESIIWLREKYREGRGSVDQSGGFASTSL